MALPTRGKLVSLRIKMSKVPEGRRFAISELLSVLSHNEELQTLELCHALHDDDAVDIPLQAPFQHMTQRLLMGRR